MKLDAYKYKDMFCELLNLDNKYIGNGFTLYYQLEHEGGILRRKDRCVFQCILSTGKCYTGRADNWLFYAKKSSFNFFASFFNDFKVCFNKSTPMEIKDKFPILEKMYYSHTSLHTIEDDYGLKFNCDAEPASFYTREISVIEGSTLTEHVIRDIVNVVNILNNAVEEYLRFKKTRYYRIIEPNINNIKNKLETGASIYMIYRIAKLAYSLYSGSSTSDGDPDINVDFDSSSFDNLSSQDMVDYLCETDFDVSDNQSDISFTGSGDKYTDNDYNRESADDFLKQEAYYREKGDNAAADAAHRQAMKHKGRIND